MWAVLKMVTAIASATGIVLHVEVIVVNNFHLFMQKKSTSV